MTVAQATELSSLEAVKSLELEYVGERRKAAGVAERDPLKGLALSGGGIRSAVFCLGVLQALAAKDWLRYFDYLSTVSGGGYIGAALTWWTSGRSGAQELNGVRLDGVTPETFPWGVEDPATLKPDSPAYLLLEHLRQHGSYLAPGHGITLQSGVAVVLRGLALNLLVWLPLTVLVLAVLLLPTVLWPQPAAIPSAEAARSAASGWPDLSYPIGYLALLSGGGILAVTFCAQSIRYSLSTAQERKGGARRYGYRRSFDAQAGGLLLLIAGFSIIGSLPYIASSFHDYVGKAGGPLAFLVGVAGGIYGHLQLPGRNDKQRGASGIPVTMVAPVAALLALYGFLLIAWDLANLVTLEPRWAYPVILVFVILAILSGAFVNLNYIALHRFYRDRLMEAFMPDFGHPPASVAKTADEARLSFMCVPRSARGPYHLINTNLILTNSTDPKRGVRGRASFLLSPRFCGSDAVGGWMPTENFLGNGMTLPTAMAISGAAVNPGGAADGIGPTRSRSVALLLALLDIRLGYWVRNPKRNAKRRCPNHFVPGLAEFVAWSDPENKPFLQLSDGGHFEDLGVYELLRRRVKLIVAVDADQDEDFGFDDLQNLLALAQQDFGAFVDFGADGLAPLMPSLPVAYPYDLTCSAEAFIHGKITYSDQSEGDLFYVKAALLKDLRLQLLGYKDADPSFPDDPTLNQFFDDAKFEAYRALGFAIGTRLAADKTFQALMTS